MKHIKLFLFSFLLLLPTAAQCMEKVITKQKTIQDIQSDRDFIITDRLCGGLTTTWPFDSTFFQDNWPAILHDLEKNQKCYASKFKTYTDFRTYKDSPQQSYSLLGLAMIAIRINNDPSPYYKKAQLIQNLRNKNKQNEPTFAEKNF